MIKKTVEESLKELIDKHDREVIELLNNRETSFQELENLTLQLKQISEQLKELNKQTTTNTKKKYIIESLTPTMITLTNQLKDFEIKINNMNNSIISLQNKVTDLNYTITRLRTANIFKSV